MLLSEKLMGVPQKVAAALWLPALPPLWSVAVTSGCRHFHPYGRSAVAFQLLGTSSPTVGRRHLWSMKLHALTDVVSYMV